MKNKDKMLLKVKNLRDLLQSKVLGVDKEDHPLLPKIYCNILFFFKFYRREGNKKDNIFEDP